MVYIIGHGEYTVLTIDNLSREREVVGYRLMEVSNNKDKIGLLVQFD